MLKWISSNTFFIDEFVYILCGLISILTAFRGLKNKEARIGTFLFWFLVGIIFAFGGFLVKYLPDQGGIIVGAMLVVCGVLTLTKQVKIGEFTPPTDEERRKNADKIGWKIFIPALIMAGLAFLMSQFKSFNFIIGTDAKGKDIIFGFSTAQVLGVSAVIAFIIALLIAKPKVEDMKEDTSRLLMQVGASSLLPQLLGALGIVFTAAGVGNLIGNFAGSIVGDGGRVAGVVAYCLGMVIFTDYGQRICSIYCNYNRRRNSFCNSTRWKSCSSRSTWNDLRLLWYSINSYGCKLQYCSGRNTRN